MVSCKNNNKKTQSKNPSQEEVQEMKQALADSVLAEIDAFADQYSDAASKAFRLQAMELTDDEKQVKPDYLLDPSLVSKFVTKSQNTMLWSYTSLRMESEKYMICPGTMVRRQLPNSLQI